MPESSRNFFEPRFGHDFSNVRLHTDTIATKSAQSINALAYTSGNNIVFNSGYYSPESDSGKRLMAHELTHTLQQGGNASGIQRTCTAAAICSAPSIPGSAGGFDNSEELREAAARARRKRMTSARALRTPATRAMQDSWKYLPDMGTNAGTGIYYPGYFYRPGHVARNRGAYGRLFCLEYRFPARRHHRSGYCRSGKTLCFCA